ncbi:hypothetical protein RU639_002048 [Aspergillus parasiticus]
MAFDHIHPSQTRFSCEVCRRQKTKCQRIRRNDPKCARCTILGVECTPGQQGKVGRPKQGTASRKDVSKLSETAGCARHSGKEARVSSFRGC